MQAVELVVEAATVVAYLVGAGVLTSIGLLAEHTGVADLLAGQTVVGAWLIVVGGVALFAGLYMLGYRSLWPRLLADARRLVGAR